MIKNFSEDDFILTSEFLNWYFEKHLIQQPELQEGTKYLENLTQTKIQNFTMEIYEEIAILLIDYINNSFLIHKPLKVLFDKIKQPLNIALKEYKLLQRLLILYTYQIEYSI